ncbi:MULTISPECIES: hypothetical protein [unclassified Pseudomonas]|uniref:hypothetical protein n=1 Tax=unclassified Pseudomonas TaxID=196821 RepID=UPI000BC8AA29|nr:MULTISPECIES: hypothetical protein [unclassified Pseudomonas]PVZ19817.1 hypothetical protein F474_00407 [Pseudomonas sp. URIL14HWK12:I12]PVZ26883.1 hypothetical protein F470_00062 [Pseudomonas sp. URIL14HWK12:I10]PVZ37772.1 hypothetical protein F472_00407 [Pseudomonas sp. URIL14HWK12:I11]SNZ05729.1 hypothetical protein SAMN05660463_00997 [Pseudomonas sp. URIL14HWK12:I9]
MFRLNSFRETLEVIAACSDDQVVWQRYAWVYVQGGARLLDSRFYLASREDEDDEGRLLALVERYDLSPCLEAATFADVLCVQKRQQPHSGLEDYALALEHYAEWDAFLELPCADAPQPAEHGLAKGLYAEHDLWLAGYAPDQLASTAREVSAVMGINIAKALQACRGLPVRLGERITGDQCLQIEARFSALSASLQRVTYRSFPWQ